MIEICAQTPHSASKTRSTAAGRIVGPRRTSLKHLTSRFMRRTFQDLGRAAQVHDFVVNAISGHATVQMHRHYSTVDGAEVRAGLAKVISLAGFVRAHRGAATASSGDAGGDAAAHKETASPVGA